MYLPRDELKRTARAPAKLNLYLEVHQQQDDGFHELTTVIVPIRLADDLSLTATLPPTDREVGGIALKVYDCRAQYNGNRGVSVPAVDNLVVRALELLQTRSGTRHGARVELVKRIPLAAGLGGGSSDAAAAIVLANRAWRLHWSRDRLADLAAEIGSDVPFFLEPGAAVCRGRGERIERLPTMRPLHFVIVKPPLGLTTAEVFHAHDKLFSHSHNQHPTSNTRHSVSGIPFPELAAGRWSNLREWMFNRLQVAAATLTRWIGEVSRVFDRLDVMAHQLTGSGSGYFGVCRHATHARRLASILRTRQLGLVYATRSCQ